MTDIEKLQSYYKAIIELNTLRGEFDENENYDHVDVLIPPATKIKEYKWNADNVVTETHEFPFSAIEDVTSRIRKKIAYRKSKLLPDLVTKENSD